MTQTMNRLARCRREALAGSGEPAAERPRSILCPASAVPACDPGIEDRDDFARIALSLFRFIGAAYVTGCSDCWEAAHRFADETCSVRDGALLVARVAAVVRLMRMGRASDPAYLPPCCNRLSKHESQLMSLLQAACDGASRELETGASTLVDGEQKDAIVQAINALAALSNERSALRASSSSRSVRVPSLVGSL